MSDYKDAGVDVERGYEAVRRMRAHVQATYDENVLGGLGGFGALYALPAGTYQNPVLVAGTDGVGTKLKLAFELDRHDTVGIDCVAMCVNDVVCQGASPLFFLDYMATGHLSPIQVEQIVAGIAQGCLQAGCALIGGETAEMPGFYPKGEYDLAGFCVGAVDRDRIIDGSRITEGCKLIGLASSGAHSNGFSLIRKLIADQGIDLNEKESSLGGKTVGEALLAPTRIYVKSILALQKILPLLGVAHITGGGFIENIPRMMPKGLSPRLCLGNWPIPPLFDLLAKWGNIAETSMFNTFNMGLGMLICVQASDAERALSELQALGEAAYLVGDIVVGDGALVMA